MPEARLSNPRKRQRTEHHPPSQAPSKRQKKRHHHSDSVGGYIDTPAFWDSLSKIWLTKHALREFDRRNTRNILAEQKSTHQRISAADFLSNCATTRLEEIKRLARRGGPDLSDVIGYPEPTPLHRKMSSSRSASYRNRGSSSTRRTKSNGKTTTGKTTTGKDGGSKPSKPDDANYQQKLIDGGVLPYGYEYPDGHVPPLPSNWDEVNQRLASYRASLSPSTFPEEAYKEFVRADARAFNEDEVKDSVLPTMLNAIGASRGASHNVLFTNIDPITADIAQAKPDYYYGARPEQIHADVREKLSSHIVPSGSTHLPAAPNFFLEAKGPNGSLAVGQRQACHDGALGARAMQSLHSYGQSEPAYDNNACTISSIYHGGQLKMYGHSVAQPGGPGTRPEYYMHQLKGWSMTGDKDAFLQGATAFKNTGDLTEEYRNAAIARANEIAAQTIEDEDEDEDEDAEEGATYESQSQEAITSQDDTNEAVQDDTDTSLDELAYGYNPSRKRPNPRRQSRSRKRASTSSSTSRTAATESWTFVNGEYHCFQAREKVRSQRDLPHEVWVYNEEGWPNSGGRQWCYCNSGGTAEYR